MVSANSYRYSIARSVTAGTSALVTVGLIGWLLRGGALLGAMLASIPLWREFDPFVVIQRPRRRDDQPDSPEVESLFGSHEGVVPLSTT